LTRQKESIDGKATAQVWNWIRKNPWVKEGDEVMRKILVLSFLVLIASPAWGAVAVEQKLLEERAVYQRILNPTTQ
jgi:hypothetical protein